MHCIEFDILIDHMTFRDTHFDGPRDDSHERLWASGVMSIGKKSHWRNEDANVTDERVGLYGVFDGLGAHLLADRASLTAADTVRDHVRGALRGEPLTDVTVGAQILKAAFLQANQRVQDLAEASPVRRIGRMAKFPASTGAVVLLVREEGQTFAVVAHVGDSRVYVQHPSGNLEKITHDDNVIKHMVARGELTRAEADAIDARFDAVEDPSQLDKVDAEMFRHTFSVSNAFGKSENKFQEPDSTIVHLQSGDRLLLTTDGVHRSLTSKKIQEIAAQRASAQTVATALVEEAKKGNSPRVVDDDTTAIVVDITPQNG